MPDEKFRRCHAVTACWEGGWSDHAADPGGRTMYGITEAVYHAWLAAGGDRPRPVRQITRGEAETIYRDNYWLPCGGPTLAPGVDLATYDASVNSGVSRGRKWLLVSVGGLDDETVKRLCARRLSFVQGLRTWGVFGRGWARRIANIEAKGVAWALAARDWPAEVVREQLGAEASAAEDTAGKQAAGGAGAAGGGAVSTIVEQGSGLPAWLPAAIAVVCIAGFVWLMVRSRINRERAEAYRREATSHG